MQRLRETLAHGGIATLAVLFASAFAAFQLANALAQVGVVALQQHLIDPESGGSGLDFRIAGTDIELSGVLQGALALLLIAVLLFGVWRLTRRASQECPECRSEIPRHASVCRYCTAELPAAST